MSKSVLNNGYRLMYLQVLETYEIDRVKIHDVSVTHDSKRFVGVGPLLRSPDGLVPSRSRAEKVLVGKDIQIS